MENATGYIIIVLLGLAGFMGAYLFNKVMKKADAHDDQLIKHAEYHAKFKTDYELFKQKIELGLEARMAEEKRLDKILYDINCFVTLHETFISELKLRKKLEEEYGKNS